MLDEVEDEYEDEDDEDQNCEWTPTQLLIVWGGIFLTVSTIVWAIAIANIYSRSPDALSICASKAPYQQTEFCFGLLKQQQEEKK
jgi:hypothetical protein